MQALKDAAILLALLVLAATIRIAPLEDSVDLMPEAKAATAERSVEASRSSPVVRSSSCTRESRMQPLELVRPSTLHPMGARPQPSRAERDQRSRARVSIHLERDRPIEAAIENCPTDPDRSCEVLATGSTC